MICCMFLVSLVAAILETNCCIERTKRRKALRKSASLMQLSPEDRFSCAGAHISILNLLEDKLDLVSILIGEINWLWYHKLCLAAG